MSGYSPGATVLYQGDQWIVIKDNGAMVKIGRNDKTKHVYRTDLIRNRLVSVQTFRAANPQRHPSPDAAPDWLPPVGGGPERLNKKKAGANKGGIDGTRND